MNLWSISAAHPSFFTAATLYDLLTTYQVINHQGLHSCRCIILPLNCQLTLKLCIQVTTQNFNHHHCISPVANITHTSSLYQVIKHLHKVSKTIGYAWQGIGVHVSFTTSSFYCMCSSLNTQIFISLDIHYLCHCKESIPDHHDLHHFISVCYVLKQVIAFFTMVVAALFTKDGSLSKAYKKASSTLLFKPNPSLYLLHNHQCTYVT